MKTIKPEDWTDLRLNMLVYALTGAGKTHFCGTVQDCPETSPTLVVDVGGGRTTLVGKGIRTVRPKSMTEIQEVYDYFRHKNWRKGKQTYRSVCLDGITGIQQELVMPMVKEEGADPYEDLTIGDPPDRQDWLKGHEVVRRTLRAFRDLCLLDEPERRVHVVMTTLEKMDEKRQIICPQLPGIMGVECGSYVDILARLSIETREEEEGPRLRYLLLDEIVDDDGNTCLSKNRGSKLGSGMWRPTMAKLYKRWSASTEEVA